MFRHNQLEIKSDLILVISNLYNYLIILILITVTPKYTFFNEFYIS